MEQLKMDRKYLKRISVPFNRMNPDGDIKDIMESTEIQNAKPEHLKPYKVQFVSKYHKKQRYYFDKNNKWK